MLSARTGKVMNKRRNVIVFVCVGLWAALIGRLFYLQIIKHDEYKAAVAENIERETTISASRGTIYDRNMVQLASNITTYRVFIAPNCIENEEEAKLIAQNLSELLGVDYDEVYKRTQMNWRADETIKKNVDADTGNLVREFINNNELSRKVYLEASSKRYYPYGSLASSVIGLSGTDTGLIGVELSYDEYLKGTDGRYITAKSGNGGSMPFKYDTYVDATNGYNVVTSLDTTIQAILEEQLEAAYENADPLDRATGVVMNPKTGEIYAMATYPSFDLNDPYTLNEDAQTSFDELIAEKGYTKGSEEYQSAFTEAVYSMWRNKSVSELYEPGSTFKVITTAMALEENVVTFDDVFSCSGSYRVEGWSKPIKCHKKGGHGTNPFWHMLQQSCNPTLMQVGERIGLEKFYAYFEAFGFTSTTGIDLPGEARGLYQSYSAFNQVSLAVYSFGQTFKTTPIQELTAICAVANGGYLVTPHVVNQLVDDNGNIVADFTDSVKYQVVSTEVCNSISTVLEDGVAHDGGAKNARVNGYKIAAKTGTSEIRDEITQEGETKHVVCSTVAYAPADDPQVAVIITVGKPTRGSLYGSYIAAPFVSNTLEEILPYLGVDREVDETAITLGNFVNTEIGEAKSIAEKAGLKVVVKGEGKKVTAQVPASGSKIEQNGSIIFYTDGELPQATVVVPDVAGMTAAQANRALSELGLNVHITGIDGSGTHVFSQSIAPETEVSEGTVVTIDMRFTSGLSDN